MFFLLNKRKGSVDDSNVQNSQFSTSDSLNSTAARKKEAPPTFPLKGAKSVNIIPSSVTNSRGVPHPDDRIQTTFTVSNSTFDESDEMMMDMKKPPPNPPPPIPNHKRHLNGHSPTDDFASSSSINGTTTNGFKASTASIAPKKPQSVIPPPIMTNGATKFTSSKELHSPSGIPVLKLNGFVGFDSLPYQLVHKCQKQGFQFNLLVCGETGMGKTTLVESLFNMKLEFEPCNNELKTVELRTKTCEMVEGGVSVKLRIVETAGFGDQLDKEKSSSAKIIVDYINEQFESYLKEELKVCRHLARYDDTRIHACLYFISPTGHGLKALDVVTIRELAKRVNVIPVIAKSDTTCKDELVRFKKKILSELKANNIEIYQFPIDDETVRKENEALNSLMPFAVVGSTDFVERDGKLVRARRYPWGIVEVENVDHCDFVKLREALLRINVDSLRTRTHKHLYEAYRRERLREMKMKDGDCGPKMMEAFKQKEKEFRDEMKQKDDDFQRQFIDRVNAKEEELKRREEVLLIREKEQREKFEEEFSRLESSLNSIREEKAKLEAKNTLHSKKNKQRL
uniref:Septin-type G domain-containing protein n=1 Tax=Panagrolaimus superbus TaxID=310955 RepID=A0A914YZT2_9BILA